MSTRNMTRYGIFALLAMFLTGQAAMSENKAKVAAQQVVDQLDAIVTLAEDQKASLLKQCQGFYKANSAAIPDSDGTQWPPEEAYSVFFLPGSVYGIFEANLSASQMDKIDAYNLKQGVDHRMKLIDRMVALTDSQRVDIKPVLEKEVTAQIQIKANLLYTPNSGWTRESLAKIHSESDSALVSILTQEQLAKYTAGIDTDDHER